MSKLKPPPYSKRIHEMRRRGVHPDLALVIYDAEWKWEPNPDAVPMIFIPATNYAPDQYDFSCLAGLWVDLVLVAVNDSAIKLAIAIGKVANKVDVVFKRTINEFDAEYDAFLESFTQGEHMSFDELMKLVKGQLPVVVEELDLSSFLHAHGTYHTVNGERVFVWPDGWNDALNADYEARCDKLLTFYEEQRIQLPDFRAELKRLRKSAPGVRAHG